MNIRRFFTLPALLLLVLGAAPAPPDPRIAAMLHSVSATDLRAIDTLLVAFGTRNAFSEQLKSRTRGVFAARDWIRAQFEEAAKSAGGRMTVSYDTYVQPKTDRTPRDVTISSVIAVLKGDDPDGRTYVMSSHYDSRNSDGNDATRDARAPTITARERPPLSKLQKLWRKRPFTARSSSHASMVRSRVCSARDTTPARPKRRTK